MTTHQDEFMRIAEKVWLVGLDENRTRVETLRARDALLESSKRRIATVAHPLFPYPDHPLVLVEGKTDVRHLRRAASSIGLRPRWKLASLTDIEPELSGGDVVVRYLAANRTVLKSRPTYAPVLVLRDWETNEKTVNDTKKVVTVHERSGVLRCPADISNPELGQTFRGIERYLATELVEQVIAPEDLRPKSVRKRYPLGIEKKTLDGYKQALVEAHEQAPDSGQYLANLVRWLDKRVETAVSKVPVEEMLA